MAPPRVQPGTVEQALANGRRLLDVDANAAALQAQTLLRSNPRNTAALRLLAAALRRLGKAGDAERIEMEAIRAARFDPVIGPAANLLQQGRAVEAEAMLAPFVDRQGDEDAAALLLLGEIAGRRNAFSEAEALLRRALAAAPAYGEAQVALARLLFAQARAAEALPWVDSALKAAPGNLSLLRFKATLLGECGRHEDAIAAYEQLLAGHPDIVALWISYGDSLRTAGRKAESIAAYRRALAIDPAFGRSWWSLASLRAKPLEEPDLAAMRQALDARPDDADNLYHLHFALGTALEERREHEPSFHHYAEGNRIRRAMLDYDAGDVTREVERSERLFTAAFFGERSGSGDPAPDPIFILGMPRSGSTLVEQILASHPEVEGTAELPIVPVLVQTMVSDHKLAAGTSWRELLPHIGREELAALGAEYLRRARPWRRTDRPFFVDKLPHNWADIPFILSILPNARIVDVRRAPLDCCFSNFKLLFAQGHPSSYSLEEIAAYYRDYVRMMRHLDKALPGRIHRVVYEEMVENLDAEVRRLLDYLGLPFDPACLAFHETRRAVATASSEQVRKPLNRSGIGAWKPFESWLGPLKDALGDLPESYTA